MILWSSQTFDYKGEAEYERSYQKISYEQDISFYKAVWNMTKCIFGLILNKKAKIYKRID